jgi:hypothetical protein
MREVLSTTSPKKLHPSKEPKPLYPSELQDIFTMSFHLIIGASLVPSSLSAKESPSRLCSATRPALSSWLKKNTSAVKSDELELQK